MALIRGPPPLRASPRPKATTRARTSPQDAPGAGGIPLHPSPPILQVEKLARTLFLWKIDVHDQKERVYEMRRWNEALVTNMLPEHVARHFLGSKKRDEVRGHPGWHHSPAVP